MAEEDRSYVIPCNDQEKHLLARLIQAEAEGEPFAGKLAVAAVVVNRVLREGFPSTVREVIYQPGQFESVGNGRLDAVGAPDTECLEAAEAALRGEDPTRGAVFFYNPRKAKATWLKVRPFRVAIGKHVFLA